MIFTKIDLVLLLFLTSFVCFDILYLLSAFETRNKMHVERIRSTESGALFCFSFPVQVGCSEVYFDFTALNMYNNKTVIPTFQNLRMIP